MVYESPVIRFSNAAAATATRWTLYPFYALMSSAAQHRIIMMMGMMTAGGWRSSLVVVAVHLQEDEEL